MFAKTSSQRSDRELVAAWSHDELKTEFLAPHHCRKVEHKHRPHLLELEVKKAARPNNSVHQADIGRMRHMGIWDGSHALA